MQRNEQTVAPLPVAMPPTAKAPGEKEDPELADKALSLCPPSGVEVSGGASHHVFLALAFEFPRYVASKSMGLVSSAHVLPRVP